MTTVSTSCPPNLHMTVACPRSGLPALSERVEQKFFVPPQRQELAFALLRRCCRADGQYPMDQVNSLYFDTHDLAEHRRSDAGDYDKDKIRIRWYGEDCDPHRMDCFSDGDQPVRVWLERKTRRGFASTKQRVELQAPASKLAIAALPQGIISPTLLVQTVARFGLFTEAPLTPAIAISYRRYRFVEPETGFRISIDWRVRSSMVLPGWGRGERALELPGAVVEIKGARFEIPRSLQEMAGIGASWTRFSKYSSCIEGHESAGGGVSRLWPNGVMDACYSNCGRRAKSGKPDHENGLKR